MPGITTLIAYTGVLDTIIRDIPEAQAIWSTLKTMMIGGQEPTLDQWAALDAQIAANHQALQLAT